MASRTDGLPMEVRKAYREKLKPVIDKSDVILKGLKLDLDILWKDIDAIIRNPIDPPKLIDGELTLKQAITVFDRMLKRRNFILYMKVTCLEAKRRIDLLWKHTYEMLCRKELVACIRTESLRDANIDYVLWPIKERKKRLKTYIVELESLLWCLKDNQNAVIAQLSGWREKTWAEKKGY